MDKHKDYSQPNLEEEIIHRFTYHPPRVDQAIYRYKVIRSQALKLANVLVDCCPDSRELRTSLTKLDEVVFFANAAIARNEQ